MARQKYHVLIPQICDYVALNGKWDFVGMIKLRVFLIWKDYPGGPNTITIAPRRDGQKGQSQMRRCDEGRED